MRLRPPNIAKCSNILCFQAVLVTVVLLAAFGNDGHRLNFGIQDFLGVGTSLGLALATPLVLMAYLFGGSLLVMVRTDQEMKMQGYLEEDCPDFESETPRMMFASRH